MGRRKARNNKRAKGEAGKEELPFLFGVKGRERIAQVVCGAVFLLVAAAIAYAPALECGFIWDDPQYLINNPTIKNASGLKDIWFGIERSPDAFFALKPATPQYYPLVFTTFWIEHSLWEFDSYGYHLTNILLHALNAVLLWFVLRKLSVPGAFAAAAVFALHPVHVESVAWITERKNVLSLFFYLASALVYLRFALPAPVSSGEKSLSGGSARQLGMYVISGFLFSLSLLSKTVACTMPAAILLVLWWKKESIRPRDVVPLVPFFVLGILMGCLTAVMEETHVGASGTEWSLSFLARCLVAGRVPWFYAWKLAWPANLMFIYPRWEIDTRALWQYLFPVCLAGAVLVLWTMRRKTGKGPLVGTLFFIGTLLPALGFFNVYPMRFSFVADHFQYHASIGLIAVAAAAVAAALRRLGSQAGVAGFASLGVVLCVFGGLCSSQTALYQSQEVLWRRTLSKNPSAWIAMTNLSEILVARGEVDEGMELCSKALVLKPGLPEAHGNLANALYCKKRYEEALGHYHRVLELDPGNLKAMNNMAATQEALGRLGEAAAGYRAALALEPDYASAHYNLANVLVKQGNNEDAVTHYSAAIELDPDFLNALYKLGSLYLSTGEHEKGKASLRKALSLARKAGRRDMVRKIEAVLQ